jgi:hypothetical protein
MTGILYQDWLRSLAHMPRPTRRVPCRVCGGRPAVLGRLRAVRWWVPAYLTNGAEPLWTDRHHEVSACRACGGTGYWEV